MRSPLFLLTGMLFTFMLTISPVQADIEIGQTAPDFTLTDQHNQSITLSQQKGQWVVLYFYPKNDTPGCTKEACSFRDNINKLISQKAVILGVSVDSVSSHQDFSKKYQLPFSLLADEDGKVASQYDALLDLKLIKFAKRHSFIIDPAGKVVRIYRDVDPQEHVREVLKDLKSLQQHS